MVKEGEIDTRREGVVVVLASGDQPGGQNQDSQILYRLILWKLQTLHATIIQTRLQT